MTQPTTPRATYRLQLTREFGFAEAARVVPYLAHLGISHVYASPFLAARSGSTHGYDISDHGLLNPELGGADGFRKLTAALQAHDLGLIADIVPNHMCVRGTGNHRWLSVLEWGPRAQAAPWFDIDWTPDRRYLRNKVLVPVLGGQYGVELERGSLQLAFDAEAGGFAVWAYDTHMLPVRPIDYGRILGARHPELERFGDLFANLPVLDPQVENQANALKAALAERARKDPELHAAIAQALARFNGTPGRPASWTRLHRLIHRQHWRAAHFRVASDDINYRRFFDINDLAGIRMDRPEVFEQCHRLIFEMMEAGAISGLRIDHVDGLLDPKGYLSRLREAAPRRDFYLVVEKILAPHESLREDWPVEGTTGYEFANLVLRLLMDPAGEIAMTDTYVNFTGERQSFAEVARESKLRIMDNELASEMNVLAGAVVRVARQNPRTADFTRNILHRALKQVLACFPVYRSYLDWDGLAREADRRDIDWAIAQGRKNDSALDPSVFDFLKDLLAADLVAQPHSGFSREAVVRCAMKVQQFSGPVMAKSLEDTAFYRYTRFIALNEVGGSPDQFAISTAAFHKANAARARYWPRSMLATATHDTKRGEGARARLAVLSEIPGDWRDQVHAWSRILRARRGDVEGVGPPDRRDEYFLYQTLLASWPAHMLERIPARDILAPFAARVTGTMVKAIREAKIRSTWAVPNTAYEDAVTSFVADALDPSSSGFFDAFLPFAARVAAFGAWNSLVQTVLKLTVPGVPDIYQGAELWDLSMVDPDNRRPVNFAARMRILEEGGRISLDKWHDGSFKLRAIAALLACRRGAPALFDQGAYTPLTAEGPDAGRVCAFLRHHGDARLLVAIACFPARGPRIDAEVLLPDEVRTLPWRNVFTGEDGGAVDFGAGPAVVLIAP